METTPRDMPSSLLWDAVIYQWLDGALELRGDKEWETIWANQAQIAQIFGVDRTVITKHLSNIFKSDELDKKVVSANFAHTTPHGFQIDKTQTRNVVYYNLDVILAVGYRVNSWTATKFRQRATQTLKQHITQWFTINHKRIQRNYTAFLRAVEDIKQLNVSQVVNQSAIGFRDCVVWSKKTII